MPEAPGHSGLKRGLRGAEVDRVDAARATASPATDAVGDLRTLALSRHAAISIETDDEQRVDSILRLVARELGVPLYEWTVTDGLVRDGGAAGIYGTGQPTTGLATIADLGFEAIFVLKDFSSQLTQPVVSRALNDLVTQFASRRQISTIVLVGAAVTIPPDLAPLVTRYDLKPPAPEE